MSRGKQVTCNCIGYTFPHRFGSGKCLGKPVLAKQNTEHPVVTQEQGERINTALLENYPEWCARVAELGKQKLTPAEAAHLRMLAALKAQKGKL